MPKPGPRPYECGRRAWHSDRHQPIRGSVIQEIFRIVNKVHCSATRKNREWQEKLPIVVLKAEEIMYSKANSQAEYSDLKTLWERVNDAINVIIRRDESTETGEKILQPCIEAALHLGCTPRRASRSQRNETPKYYLWPGTSETTSVPIPNDGPFTKPYTNLKPISPHIIHPNSQLSTLPLNSCFKGDEQCIYNSNCVRKIPLFRPSGSHPPALWPVYPLYYDNGENSCPIQPDELKLCSSRPFDSIYHRNAPKKIWGSNHESNSSTTQGMECDLTLRLGSPVAPGGGIGKNCSSEDRSKNKQSRHEIQETPWQKGKHFLPHSG